MIMLPASQICCFIYHRIVVMSVKNMTLLTQNLLERDVVVKENLKLIDVMLI